MNRLRPRALLFACIASTWLAGCSSDEPTDDAAPASDAVASEGEATDATGVTTDASPGTAPPAASAELLTPIERDLPEFTLESLDNGTFASADLLGKPWIVNFWATWCGPCVEEMPAMNRAWQDVGPEGIGMLAINAGEGRDAIDTFLAQVPVDFEILLGDADTLPDWSVRALPTTYIIDSEGRIVMQALGPREWDDPQLLDQVRALLQN